MFLIFFILKIKSRDAGLLIQLLFANFAFLAEMYWPKLGRAKVSVFARGLRLLRGSQPPAGVSLSPAADAPSWTRPRRRVDVGSSSEKKREAMRSHESQRVKFLCSSLQLSTSGEKNNNFSQTFGTSPQIYENDFFWRSGEPPIY